MDGKALLGSVLGVPLVDDLGTYLGLPSRFPCSKKICFRTVVERVKKAVQGWKRSFFSVGGKETLIMSVAQVIPTYAMSCFRLPKTVCQEITKEISKFWWGSSDTCMKMHWKS